VEFHGALKPKLEGGTVIGAGPANLAFDAGCGTLRHVSGKCGSRGTSQ
jgi:hypothetical protein